MGHQSQNLTHWRFLWVRLMIKARDAAVFVGLGFVRPTRARQPPDVRLELGDQRAGRLPRLHQHRRHANQGTANQHAADTEREVVQGGLTGRGIGLAAFQDGGIEGRRNCGASSAVARDARPTIVAVQSRATMCSAGLPSAVRCMLCARVQARIARANDALAAFSRVESGVSNSCGKAAPVGCSGTPR